MIALWLAACGSEPPTAAPGAVGAAEGPRSTAALPDRFDLGRPAPAERIAEWDIDVGPAGAEFPPGQGTVADGKALYAGKCAACHGADAIGGPGFLGPRLVATEPLDGFEKDWHLPKAIGNWWPYATTLFDYTRRAMPQTAPGSLTADETYALVAFLLAENRAVPADFVADADSIRGVKMPTRVRFVPDDRETTNQFR